MGLHEERSTSQSVVDIRHVHNLNERTKELKCLYQAIQLLGSAEYESLEKAVQKLVDIMPGGWQFYTVACARVVIGDQEFRSERYVLSPWLMGSDIHVDKEKVGSVEIIYTEMRPECFQGPFMEEEVFLLEAIAKLIGQVLKRKKLEEEKTKLFLDVQKNYEKILSGFIPICASCKDIRDGDGVWHRLEAYVQKQTGATFSHGICPECIKKLYPYIENR